MRRMCALVMILTTLLLCACSPSAPTGSSASTPSNLPGSCTTVPGSSAAEPDDQPAYDGSPVTIVLEHAFTINKQWQILDQYIAQFQARYPGITVEHYSMGDAEDIFTKVSMLKDSGNYANVVVCDPYHAQAYQQMGLLVSMEDMAGSEAQQLWADGTADLFGLTEEQRAGIAAFYDQGIVDGELRSLPLTRWANVLYYNKEFFTENGLPVPATWTEMEQVCQQILQIDPESTPLLVQADVWMYEMMCAQQGLDITIPEGLFAGNAAESILLKLRQWEEKGYMDTDAENRTIRESFAGQGYHPRGYMVIDNSYGANAYFSGFEVGIARVPQEETGQAALPTSGLDFCILKKDSQQQMLASWLLVEFLATNADFQTELAMCSGYIPVTAAVMENDAFAAFFATADGRNNLKAGSVKFCMDDPSYVRRPAFAYQKQVEDSVKDLITQCVYEDADDVQAHIRDQLQQHYKKHT